MPLQDIPYSTHPHTTLMPVMSGTQPRACATHVKQFKQDPYWCVPTLTANYQVHSTNIFSTLSSSNTNWRTKSQWPFLMGIEIRYLISYTGEISTVWPRSNLFIIHQCVFLLLTSKSSASARCSIFIFQYHFHYSCRKRFPNRGKNKFAVLFTPNDTSFEEVLGTLLGIFFEGRKW